MAPADDDARGPAAAPDAAPGTYITLGGRTVELERHPTDFTVLAPAAMIAAGEAPAVPDATVAPVAPGMCRVRVPDSDSLDATAAQRDAAMEAVRVQAVAHHVYRTTDTKEEVVIDNHVLLKLWHDDPAALQEIIEAYSLVPTGERAGDEYVLRVTEATGSNPLKVANELARRPEVEYCQPQVLLPMERFQAPRTESYRLFSHQWYLTSDLVTSPELAPSAGIQAPEAWQLTTGAPEVVLAVIDDGFDLGHPAFRNKRIHPAARDFAVLPEDANPSSEGADFHGTCVASIATGSLHGDGMVGVAPGCTFLPIRIGFGPLAPQVGMLQVFRYVSQHADVVNCSFGTNPSTIDRMSPGFRQEVTNLARSGGRRRKGLVFVFAAGNDDAPTRLRPAENVNGVRFVRPGVAEIVHLPAGTDIFSGYPLIEGVVVVGAVSSLKRKSGYSNWGPHLTVCAPSNNMHYVTRFIRPDAGLPDRALFVANYRGLGQVAAVNRAGRGRPFEPLPDDLATPDFSEQFYTRTFGGTSGAAPVVSGVAALMLSVNPDLTAAQVIQILRSTADRDLDTALDLAGDPNVQGKDGRFAGDRSPFFGSGKVNARRAVERALALRGVDALLARDAGPVDAAAPVRLMAVPTDGGEAVFGVRVARFGETGTRTVVARVKASGPMKEAFIGIAADPPVPLSGGSADEKSGTVFTDSSGFLLFTFVVHADIPGLNFRCTLTEQGTTTPKFDKPGSTNEQGVGVVSGFVQF